MELAKIPRPPRVQGRIFVPIPFEPPYSDDSRRHPELLWRDIEGQTQ
jgi:hypothetical protein